MFRQERETIQELDRPCPHCGTEEVVKTVVKECFCELLFKDFKKEDIYDGWNGARSSSRPLDVAVSKQAVELLPPDFRHSEIIQNLAYASKNKGCGFRPELLHTGIWLLAPHHLITDESVQAFIERDSQYGYFCSFAHLKTLADIHNLTPTLLKYDWVMVFKDGKFIMKLAPSAIMKQVPWPPNEEVQPDAVR